MMESSWRAADLQTGHHVIDVGAGPGFASVDLAKWVGPNGSVTAVERSPGFIEVGIARAQSENLKHLSYVQADLLTDPLPVAQFEFAWCRWVITFLSAPQVAIQKVADSLKPGGKFVSHEYLQYDTWRLIPQSEPLEEFVELVIAKWKDSGGETDIARQMPDLVRGAGLTVESVKPIIFTMSPSEASWQWPSRFIRNQVPLYVNSGVLSTRESDLLLQELERATNDPNSIMVSPLVLEVISVK